jgi:glutaredoxin
MDKGEHTMNGQVQLYWAPGCSNCLRVKEFLEGRGIDHEAFNVGLDSVAADRMHELGAFEPAVFVGDNWVHGGNLAAVAELVGVEYEQPNILSPAALHDRFHVIMETLCRLLAQVDERARSYREAGADWSVIEIGYHAASAMLWFLHSYDPDGYAGEVYVCPETTLAGTADSKTAADIVERARDTLRLFDDWWDLDGGDDPMEQVVFTYWGHRTALEAYEREVWHTAQHTRQVAMYLEAVGIVPDHPLGDAELAGLPLPDRVFA